VANTVSTGPAWCESHARRLHHGMLAHYFDPSRNIIAACGSFCGASMTPDTATAATARPDASGPAHRGLRSMKHRRTECAFWTLLGTGQHRKRSSASTPGCTRVHAPVRTLLAQCWPEWSLGRRETRQVLRSLVTFIHRTHRGAVAERRDWPSERRWSAVGCRCSCCAPGAMGTAARPCAPGRALSRRRRLPGSAALKARRSGKR